METTSINFTSSSYVHHINIFHPTTCGGSPKIAGSVLQHP